MGLSYALVGDGGERGRFEVDAVGRIVVKDGERMLTSMLASVVVDDEQASRG